MANTVQLQAGTYFIGDPCYVITDREDWLGFLVSCDYFLDSCHAEYDGGNIYAGGTYFGDGRYDSNTGLDFPVDSGLIGIVPESTVDKYVSNRATLASMGHFVTFDEPFTISFDEKSETESHRFGHIVINTYGEDYDEDD